MAYIFFFIIHCGYTCVGFKIIVAVHLGWPHVAYERLILILFVLTLLIFLLLL